MLQWRWRWLVGSLLTVALLVTWLVNRGQVAEWVRWTVSLLLPLLISGYGLKKQSLDPSGAALAVVVGSLLTAASACFSVSLIVFFITSSRLTKWKAAEKRKLEEAYKEGYFELNVKICPMQASSPPSHPPSPSPPPHLPSFTPGGQRNWVQVVCNGGVASMCALLYLAEVGMTEVPLRAPGGVPDTPSLLSLAILAALSCSCGDTWASEVGSVIGGKPRLITNWKPVPTGTNGGITAVGVACSIAGGAVIGLSHFATLLVFWKFPDVTWLSQTPLIWVGALSGLTGSLVDSLLGAMLQFSGFSEKLGRVVNVPGQGVTHVSGWDVLDNHTVNLLSSLITATLIPLWWRVWTTVTHT